MQPVDIATTCVNGKITVTIGSDNHMMDLQWQF